MQTIKDWLPAIGWVVTFILGIISGGIVIPKLTRKRKIIDWAVLSESDVIPKELSKTLGVPVTITVGDKQPNSLSTIEVRIGNGGNEVIENVTVVVSFNKDSTILNVRPLEDIGELGNHIDIESMKSSTKIQLEFLNQGKSFDIEFLLSNYDLAAVNVDAAAPGLELRRRDPSRWGLPTSFLQGIRFEMLGLKYDPTAISMNLIAEELRALRKQLNKMQ